MAKKKEFSLYLDNGTTIVDDNKKVYTVEEARALWESGTVTNYNMALRSLALHNWDFEALNAYYAEMDKARGKA